jgi:hypothetical protein
MKQVFHMEHADKLVDLALKVGPGYASKTVALVADLEFKDAYRDLSRYLDQFGSCLKKTQPEADGWWSNYPAETRDHYCTEVAKLLVANLLWSQVHYCQQLVRGDVEPKIPPSEYGPRPWTLDAPPVKSPWMSPDTLYAMADRALAGRTAEMLERQLQTTAADQKKLRDSLTSALAVLRIATPSREMVALALAKTLVRNYESLHAVHLARVLQQAK